MTNRKAKKLLKDSLILLESAHYDIIAADHFLRVGYAAKALGAAGKSSSHETKLDELGCAVGDVMSAIERVLGQDSA